MRISIIGPPGAGKTTLSNILGGMFHIIHISSGDLARAHGFAGSEAERRGQLDPDEQKIRTLVLKAIGDSDTYILDGFPRTIDQIDLLRLSLDSILYLHLHRVNIGVERLLKRARPDDTLETIGARISTYYTYTYPLVSYFRDKGILLEIDASGSISDTVGKAVSKLSSLNRLEEVTRYMRRLVRKDFEGNKGTHKKGTGR